jgi:DNA sulfur modification protein DndD
MIFRSIRLKNFGIFYGQQALELEPGLYIVHGVNGRGKTTLLNAVKWALYGQVRDRPGRRLGPSDLINRVAHREGERGFSVELTLDEGDTRYFIRRTQAVAEGVESDLYMERNGQTLSRGDALAQIQALLSEEVSRFFLFDGEQLQQYEKLLFSADAEADLVKQSIEDILGLPVLANAIADLEWVTDDLGRRQSALARADAKAERIGLQAQQLEADIDSKQQDLDALRVDEEGFIATKEEKDAFLKGYENSLEALKEIESLESEIGQLEHQAAEMKGLRADALSLVWRDVLARAVAPRRAELEHTVREAQTVAVDQGVLRDQASRLDHSISSGECDLCHQHLDEDVIDRLRSELASLGDSESEESDRVNGAFLRLAKLQEIQASGRLEDALARDVRVSEIEGDIVAKRQQLGRLRSALDELPENEVSRAQKERDQALQDLGRQRAQIAGVEAEIVRLREQLQTARASLREAADTKEQHAVAAAIGLAEVLGAVFARARDQFRDELKVSVEGTATDVFLRLMHEDEAFSGLRINNNYGLEILDEHGEAAGYRSAGQEQVVALSLIAALNRNARRPAPVIMDTPFGRLDAEHSQNILRFLSEMAEQVFLLVTDREVTRDDLNGIAASITDEFDLRRDGPDRTTIVPRRSV